MRVACSIVALAAAAAVAAPAAIAQEPPGPRFRGWSGPKPQIDCHCRHRGGRAEIGETRCIRQGSRQVLARCEKPQNLPYWRILSDSCDKPLS